MSMSLSFMTLAISNLFWLLAALVAVSFDGASDLVKAAPIQAIATMRMNDNFFIFLKF
jgi:hypothetical protein